ncbi:penicillin-binding protein 2 [Candidatus Dependentiae bacterium]|nr:penicillin-binding protein 2 [Candidatus Dependentiae bacterium]MCC7414813.1 penicillin-binding protein 2 [Campylobacterota bacterium]
MMHAHTLRTGIVFLGCMLLYVALIVNLYFIQIGKHTFFTQLAHKQYTSVMKIYPPRAFIFDRTGKPLAMNQETVAAFITPNNLHEPAKIRKFLQHNFPAAFERLQKNKSAHFMYVARNLDESTQKLIQSAALDDINLLKEPSRLYPMSAAGTLIGFTNIDNKGIAGIELMFDAELAGQPMVQSLHKDARSGFFHFIQTTEQGVQGVPITLSIDGTLQFLVYQALKETVTTFGALEGSAIVMNPKNGQVLAMASFPSFDPSNMRNGDLENTKNRVVTQVYEFGSVIKTFAALAALEEAVVDPDELVDCENVATAYVDGRRINTVKSSIAGVIPFTQVIEKSNNIGIAKIVKRLGPTLYTHYLRLGFGEKTGIEFPGERAGFVNPPQNWSKQSIISLSYGYEISATVLQLAQAFSVIANEGYLIPPTLLLTNQQSAPKKERRYSQKSALLMQTIMENTVLRGTAKKAQIKGYRVMSKTGTANLLVNGLYDETKNCYSCGGIVEKGEYQRVIVVFIKQANRKGLYASTVAAPLFEQVAERTLIHEKIN